VRVWTLLALALAVTVPTAMPAEAATLAELAAAIDHVATEPDGDRVVVGHISRTLATSAETLRADRARARLGWGDFLIAYRLSHEGELSFDAIVADVHGGKAWPDIVGDHMDFATLVAEIERSKDMMEQRSEDKGPALNRAPGQKTGGGAGRGGRRR